MHESGCYMKPQPCPYCERSCTFKEFNDHVSFCGGKTKKCEECGANVLAKDFDLHLINGMCEANKQQKLAQTQNELKRF